MIDYNRQPIRATNDEDAYNLFEKIKNQSGLYYNEEFEYIPAMFGFSLQCVIDRGGYIIDDENFVIFSENFQENIEGIMDIHVLYFNSYHSLERMMNQIIERIKADELTDCSKFKIRYYTHPMVSVEQLKLFGFKEMKSNMSMFSYEVEL